MDRVVFYNFSQGRHEKDTSYGRAIIEVKHFHKNYNGGINMPKRISYEQIISALSKEETKKLQRIVGDFDMADWVKEHNRSLGNKWRTIRETVHSKTWRNDPIKFRLWYIRKFIENNGCCEYCKIPQKDLLRIYGRNDFRKGRRGNILEIDRPNNENHYDENCVLACYPCNNAKSDVFNKKQFEKIAKAIQGVWQQMAKKKKLK